MDVTVEPAVSVVVTTRTGEDVDVTVEPAESVVVKTAPLVVVTYVDPAEFVVVRTSTGAALVDVLVYVDPAESVVVITVAAAAAEPGIVLVYVLPAVSVTVVTRGAPEIPVLATPRKALMADSRDTKFDEYCVGRAVRKGGGVAAVRADSTMELMSPVTLAAEAALWTAMPKGTARDCGMYSEISWLAAEENCADMDLRWILVERAYGKGRCGTHAGSI